MSLDDKFRLMVPARFKDVLQQKYGGRPGATQVVVTISPDPHRNAVVYPVAEWKRYIAELQQAPVLNRYNQQILRFVTSLATISELDPQGRIRLERKIIEVSKLEKRVMVSGSTTSFLIWDEKKFNEFVEETITTADSTTDSAMNQMKGLPAGGPVIVNRPTGEGQ